MVVVVRWVIVQQQIVVGPWVIVQSRSVAVLWAITPRNSRWCRGRLRISNNWRCFGQLRISNNWRCCGRSGRSNNWRCCGLRGICYYWWCRGKRRLCDYRVCGWKQYRRNKWWCKLCGGTYGGTGIAINADEIAVSNGSGFATLTARLPKFPTSSAPPYVLGGWYFDATLKKLRIGGNAGWGNGGFSLTDLTTHISA